MCHLPVRCEHNRPISTRALQHLACRLTEEDAHNVVKGIEDSAMDVRAPAAPVRYVAIGVDACAIDGMPTILLPHRRQTFPLIRAHLDLGAASFPRWWAGAGLR